MIRYAAETSMPCLCSLDLDLWALFEDPRKKILHFVPGGRICSGVVFYRHLKFFSIGVGSRISKSMRGIRVLFKGIIGPYRIHLLLKFFYLFWFYKLVSHSMTNQNFCFQ